MGRSLPVINKGGNVKSSLPGDGSREFVYPADVKGRFTTWRRVTFYALIALWLALPLIEIGGHPAVFLDVAKREFYLFGQTFNAQDVWLMFFLLTGLAFLLAYATAILGRVWCGYACPQTVFLEGIFRPLERLIEGPREKRIKLAKAPWSFDKVWRVGLKHLLYILSAAFVSHVFVSYFVSLPQLWSMMLAGPGENPSVFVWAVVLTGLFYGNFSWFREQMCVIICPYGRLQSVLIDDDSVVIGYDEKRGEPRGKKSEKDRGACISCNRCVAVCPTGIDIRNGLQLDCIGCAACVDACDEIMIKIGQEPGLVRYDSLKGLRGDKRRFLRPRLYLYTVLGALGLVVATFAFSTHSSFEATLLRQQGMPFVVDEGVVRNAYEVQVVNKSDKERTFELRATDQKGLSFLLPAPTVTLGGLESKKLPFMVTQPKSDFTGPQDFTLEVVHGADTEAEVVTIHGKFVGPRS